MLIDSDVKTAFTVHEADDPLRLEIHRTVPHIKSLRVPIAYGPSLRIVPMSVGFLLLATGANEYQTVLEEFPAYGSVLLRRLNSP